MMIIDPPVGPWSASDDIRAWIAELEAWLVEEDVPPEELLFAGGLELLRGPLAPLPPVVKPAPEVVRAIATAKEHLARALAREAAR